MQKVYWIQTEKELNELNDFLEEVGGKVINIVATSYGVRGYEGPADNKVDHKTYKDTSAFIVVEYT